MILNNAENIYLGNSKVQKIYEGETLIWQNQQNQSPIPADYILALDFNGNIIDKAGNYTMSAVGGTNFAVGRKANTQCIEFDTTRYLKTNQYINYNGSNEFTLSVWIKLFSNSYSIINQGKTGSDSSMYGIYRTTQNKIDVRMNIGYNSNTRFLLNTTLDNVRWFHLLIRSNLRETEFFINNIFDKSVAYTMISERLSQLFFNSNEKGYVHFPLQLQDLRLYNRILSDAEIQTLYNE